MDLPSLDSLETPAALVDVARVEANLARVADYARAHGLAWRPHTKTHKTAELAARQLAAGARGLTVATLREAEVMAQVTDDLLLAYPPVGAARLARLMALPHRVRLTVALDSREALEGLGRAADASGRTVGVLVELDMGMRRVGVQSPGTPWRSRAPWPPRAAWSTAASSSIRATSAHRWPSRARCCAAVSRGWALPGSAVRRGPEARPVSGGSTPTLWRSHEVAGLTEIRPGINVLHDRNTALRWARAPGTRCAYSVLATVVSTAVPGQAVIDAGSKALAKEEGSRAAATARCWTGRRWWCAELSEEHGLLDLSAHRVAAARGRARARGAQPRLRLGQPARRAVGPGGRPRGRALAGGRTRLVAHATRRRREVPVPARLPSSSWPCSCRFLPAFPDEV